MKRKISEVENTKDSSNKRQKTVKDIKWEQKSLKSICEEFYKIKYKKNVDVAPKPLIKRKKRFQDTLDFEVMTDTRCTEELGAWGFYLSDQCDFPYTTGCKWIPNHPSKTISKNIIIRSYEENERFGATYEIELKGENRTIKGVPSWEIKSKEDLFGINDWYLQSSLLLHGSLVYGMISQVESFSYYGMSGMIGGFSNVEIKKAKAEKAKDIKDIKETKKNFSDFYNQVRNGKIDYQKIVLDTDQNKRLTEVIPFYGYAFRTHQKLLINYFESVVKFPKKVLWKNTGFPSGEEIELKSIHVNNYLGPVFKLANDVVVMHFDIYPLKNDKDVKFKNALSDIKVYFKNCEIFQKWKMDLLVNDFDSLSYGFSTQKSYAY